MPAVEQNLAGLRLVGSERMTWLKDCLRRYIAGDSIRTIARDTGRSYGFAHQILVEGGAALRGRGAPRVRRTP